MSGPGKAPRRGFKSPADAEALAAQMKPYSARLFDGDPVNLTPISEARLRDLGLLPHELDAKATNPKDEVAATKIDLSLFPPVAIVWGALGMQEGDLKYGGYNFRVAGVRASVYVAAAMRHLGKWLNGEEADPDTHVPHLGSVLACAAILADAIAQGNLNDDRPPKQSSKFYADVEAIITHLHKTFPRRAPRYRAKK